MSYYCISAKFGNDILWSEHSWYLRITSTKNAVCTVKMYERKTGDIGFIIYLSQRDYLSTSIDSLHSSFKLSVTAFCSSANVSISFF